MRFYTNVFQSGKTLYVRGWDGSTRISEKVKYEPYLFTPSPNNKETEYKALDGSYVEKTTFSDFWEMKKFTQQYEEVGGFAFYGMDKPIYTYIHDEYPDQIDYDASRINVIALDIEVDSTDAYPIVEKGDRLITAITVRRKNRRVVFGYGEFEPTDDHTTYVKCKDEKSLLDRFLRLWETEEWSPDVVTGWNIDGFDIPYLVNRIDNVLGKGASKRLSPWKILKEKALLVRGKEVQTFIPAGIAVLDYLNLYRKFTYNQQSSYTLNNIAHIELGVKKIDYSEYSDLDDLYRRNHQKFIEYNIRDVDLIFMLEEKLRFIELVYAIAYDAKVNFQDAFTSVLLWDVIIYNYLANRNIVVPQYKRAPERQFEGGFVKEPQIGMHDWVMSFDLTSLYPHIIIQYNISPETFVGKLPDITVDRLLKSPIDPGKYSTAANGCQFVKDRQGFLPALMELQFAQREDYKKLLKAAKKAGNENEVAKYDKAQLAKKIQLNSLYGSLSNVGFRFYDVDHAEAITLSGQYSIRYMEVQVNQLMNKFVDTKDVDYVIAIDTDSLYINFGPLVEKFCKGKTKDEITDFLAKMGRETIEPFMARKYEELAKTQNAFKQAMKMKRENIGDKAIWTAKKRYMMNVRDSEGERYEVAKLKIMGLETARSSTPEICREALKTAISLIMNKDEKTLQDFIADFKDKFNAAPFDEIAFPRGVNNLEKYSDDASIYKIRTPIHVKGALIFNKLLKDRDITKIEPIWSGDKIKFSYLKMPNPTHDTVIACHDFMPFDDLIPYIDYSTQFQKSFLEPLEAIINTIGWHSKEEESLESLGI